MSSSVWGMGAGRRERKSRRALEVGGVLVAFLYWWPLAAAYLVWKFAGYPMPSEWRGAVERGFPSRFAADFAGSMGFDRGRFSGTGNRAFDEYRRGEVERLERERRRLDDEAREFRDFVNDLKRAKDREEFDAYMARRRAA